MTQTNEKVVGILGGMGPEATVDLMERIIRLTPALDDIDHIRCIVDNNPKIPSRIKAIIEGGGESPGPCMADMGKRLAAWGVDFLVIPCNTAHFYYDDVNKAVDISVINLIDLVVKEVTTAHPQSSRVGILASPAIRITGLYQQRFENLHITPIYPDAHHQEILFQVIKSVKAGNTGEAVLQEYARVCTHLLAQKAEHAIVACTELSALKGELPIETMDAAEILAMEIVQVIKEGKQLDKIPWQKKNLP